MSRLETEGLRVEFRRAGVVALDGVDLAVASGETLAVVGESGSGKSTLLRAIVGLARPTDGVITLDGRDVNTLPRRRLAEHVQFVFQHAHAALDPRRRIAASVAGNLRGEGVREKVAAALAEVGLDARFLDRHPHELSGGQAQRVGIARALVAEPDLLLLDEPVSALDVSVRAQVVELLVALHESRGIGWIVVTHDLAIVRRLAARVAVMLRGRVVESGTVAEVIDDPRHPYTAALRDAIPVPEVAAARRQLDAVDVGAPAMAGWSGGCAFAGRCPVVEERCRVEVPVLRAVGPRSVACHADVGSGLGAVGRGS